MGVLISGAVSARNHYEPIYVTDTNAVTIDSYPASSGRTAKYTVQVTDTTGDIHVAEVLVTHDTVDVYMVDYSTLTNNNPLGVFDAFIVNGLVEFHFTPLVATNKTIKLHRTLISI